MTPKQLIAEMESLGLEFECDQFGPKSIEPILPPAQRRLLNELHDIVNTPEMFDAYYAELEAHLIRRERGRS